jgi:hypothetical protein
MPQCDQCRVLKAGAKSWTPLMVRMLQSPRDTRNWLMTLSLRTGQSRGFLGFFRHRNPSWSVIAAFLPSPNLTLHASCDEELSRASIQQESVDTYACVPTKSIPKVIPEYAPDFKPNGTIMLRTGINF